MLHKSMPAVNNGLLTYLLVHARKLQTACSQTDAHIKHIHTKLHTYAFMRAKEASSRVEKAESKKGSVSRLSSPWWWLVCFVRPCPALLFWETLSLSFSFSRSLLTCLACLILLLLLLLLLPYTGSLFLSFCRSLFLTETLS